MGIFSRFRDIISANINAMLDNAEDPEKLLKMMIREMEDTLIDLKSSCAGVIAQRQKIIRQQSEYQKQAKHWEARAKLAVEKGRDDLAREALIEKRHYGGRADNLNREMAELDHLIDQYQDDIKQLEEKLKSARTKQRALVQRHIHAQRKKQAQEEIRRMESVEVIKKFDELEARIEHMEAEADMINFGKKPSIEEEFNRLEFDDEIEKELEALKSPLAKS